MSSPTHSTFQPGMVGSSMARLVLPQALGKAAAMYLFLPSGLVRPRIWNENNTTITIHTAVMFKFCCQHTVHVCAQLLAPSLCSCSHPGLPCPDSAAEKNHGINPTRPTHQHVLGQPALPLGQRGGNPEGKTLFPQQGVATVAAAKRPNLVSFRVLYNGNLLWVAWPGLVFLPGLQWIADRVDTSDERERAKLIHSQAKKLHLLSTNSPSYTALL